MNIIILIIMIYYVIILLTSIIKLKSIHFLSDQDAVYTNIHYVTGVTGRDDRKRSICSTVTSLLSHVVIYEKFY